METRRIPRSAALLLAVAALACSSEASGPEGGQVATISVEPKSTSLAIGASLPLQATVRDAGGNVLNGPKIFFTSSDASIADVSSTGVVTGRTLGTAQIAASSEGQSAIAVVTVVPLPVETVTVLPATSQLNVGETAQLRAATYDASGGLLQGRAVLWSSSNTGVATVDANGLVTGRGPGSSTITATSEGKSGSASVQVTLIPIAMITLTPATATLTLGGTTQLTAVATDAAGNTLAGRTLTWQSDKTSVATVSQTGLVTAQGVGTAVISASAEGKTGTAAITVFPNPPASIAIESGDAQSAPAGSALPAQLAVRVRDSQGNPVSGVSVVWTVSTGGGSLSPNISNTDAQGIALTTWTLGQTIGTQQAAASVVGAGSVTFSATAISTQPVVTSVVVSPGGEWRAKPGQTRLFSAAAYDQNGAVMPGVTFGWTSTDASRVTISQSGLAIALRKGDAMIIASASGKSDTVQVKVR